MALHKHIIVCVFQFCLVLGASSIGLVTLASSETRLQRDDQAEEREMTRRVVRENCLICHSAEIIESQRLTATQWKAELEKMVGWGAPLPVEDQPAVIAFLTSEFSESAPPALPAREKLAVALKDVAPETGERGTSFERDSARGETLYVANCANCHGPDGQGAELGSNLVERAILMRPGDFTEVVRKGRGRMPSFSTVLDASAEADVLAWLRARQYRSPAPK